MDSEALAALRREYQDHGLVEVDLAPDPATQLRRWLRDAAAAGVTEPNAMVLATVDPAGAPSARTVLLKGLDERGLVFFTNYRSRKGRELADNPLVALVFPWYDLERQVVVRGRCERTTVAESAAYFEGRPYQAQVGAWASRQSAVVDDREAVERRWAELTVRWPRPAGSGTPDAVPVPDFWGGYRVDPLTVEFWQGRPSRLHDRLQYRRHGGPASGWVVERLSP